MSHVLPKPVPARFPLMLLLAFTVCVGVAALGMRTAAVSNGWIAGDAAGWRACLLGAGCVLLAGMAGLGVYLLNARKGMIYIPFSMMGSSLLRMVGGLFLALFVQVTGKVEARAYWFSFLVAAVAVLIVETTLALREARKCERLLDPAGSIGDGQLGVDEGTNFKQGTPTA